jgi:hypothetical protein
MELVFGRDTLIGEVRQGGQWDAIDNGRRHTSRQVASDVGDEFEEPNLSPIICYVHRLVVRHDLENHINTCVVSAKKG